MFGNFLRTGRFHNRKRAKLDLTDTFTRKEGRTEMAKKSLIAPVRSLADLRQRVDNHDQRYIRLAIVAAQNLGGSNVNSFTKAFDWLKLNAQETDENGVVKEINACRDLI